MWPQSPTCKRFAFTGINDFSLLTFIWMETVSVKLSSEDLQQLVSRKTWFYLLPTRPCMILCLQQSDSDHLIKNLCLFLFTTKMHFYRSAVFIFWQRSHFVNFACALIVCVSCMFLSVCLFLVFSLSLFPKTSLLDGAIGAIIKVVFNEVKPC